MTGYRDIEFSQIADDWDSAPLGREVEPPLLLMRNGLTVEQNKEEDELRVTRIETISDGFIAEDRVRFASGVSAEHVEKYRIRKGDILFSHINSDPHLGKTAIALKDYPDLLHGMNLLLLRANKRVLAPEFLHFLCCYYRVKGVFVKICSRSVNQSSINQAKLKALEIPLPPLPEQRKIAGVLGVVQRAMEQQERLLALTAELKKALLHQLFTAGLRGEPQKKTEIGPLPESWEVKRLEEVALIIMGQSPDGESYNADGKGVPLINGPVEFGPNPLSKTVDAKFTTKPTKFCEQGDLILCVRGSTTGRTNVANSRACIGRGVAAIRARGSQAYLNQFIVSIRDQIYTMGTGTTFPNVSSSQIKDILVPIPPLEVQTEISRILVSIDDNHEILERKRTILTALFRTLLHQLMTAQLRVHDLDSNLFDYGDVSPCAMIRKGK